MKFATTSIFKKMLNNYKLLHLAESYYLFLLILENFIIGGTYRQHVTDVLLQLCWTRCFVTSRPCHFLSAFQSRSACLCRHHKLTCSSSPRYRTHICILSLEEIYQPYTYIFHYKRLCFIRSCCKPHNYYKCCRTLKHVGIHTIPINLRY